MTSTTLDVPYFVQPTPITCQSTCLKMMALYLERSVLFQSTGAEAVAIEQIWQDINTSPDRPSKVRNAHANFKWWLEKRFPSLRFEYVRSGDEADAANRITKAIDQRMPVLVSVSHERVAGHIILVVGYEDYVPGMSSATFQLVAHDPYGRFDPSLHSKWYGKQRYAGGASLLSGSESGPGQNVHLPLHAVGRRRDGDGSAGHFILLIPHRA
jgi:hypothetical protein